MSTLLASTLCLAHLGLSLSQPLAGPIPGGPGLHFIDVGQGAALLLDSGDGVIALIDSGPSSGAEALLRALDEREVRVVDLWVHTHHDADHLGGFAPALASHDGVLGSADDLAVGQLWDRGLGAPLPDSEAFEIYLALASARRERPPAGAVFVAGALRVEVLELDPPPAVAPENDRGLALCVEVAGLRALLPGDLSAARLELAAAACGPVDLMWSSHHGAADASSPAALALADPDRVVISAGHDNDHCHPSAAALAVLHDRATWILDGAGLDPSKSCAALAPALGPEHVLVGGDLWMGADGQVWVGGPGGWARSI